MKLSPQAKIHWEKIPQAVRVKLLNNVYCPDCRAMTGIGDICGSVDRGDLVLKGICTACGAPVARLIETSEM